MNAHHIHLTFDDYTAGMKAHASNLSDRDLAFARDLWSKWNRYGDLSDKQHYWAAKLLKRAKSDGRAEGFLLPEEVNAALWHLFLSADGELKRPRFKFLCGTTEVTVYRNRRGNLTVCSGRYGDEDNLFFGYIDPNGFWTPGRNFNAAVQMALESFLADPGAFGRETGSCSFCSRELTDERSVTVGYGPVCAGHYGLPWGS